MSEPAKIFATVTMGRLGAEPPVAKGVRPRAPGQLLQKVICPHCWTVAAIDEILWIAQHPDLTGDLVLGPGAMLRFRPSCFNLSGEAIDARKMPCTSLACPRCHLLLPRALMETPALFTSIVGAPTSGKSHFLASMTWALRRQLTHGFDIAFNDADTVFNEILIEYEETLFLSGESNQLVAVRKTALQGNLYSVVRLEGRVVQLPKPFLFTLRPIAKTPPVPKRPGSEAEPVKVEPPRVHVLCLYDNAGEHFQPGMDTAASPATQHLARSAVIFFLYDPTQHPRFRERCRGVSADPQLQPSARGLRQETLLTETALRIRKYAGVSEQTSHKKPLIVIVSKADIWLPLLDVDLTQDPVVPATDNGTGGLIVDVSRIESVSARLRSLLMTFAPEFVAAAEDFGERVVYIPVSSLGRGPEVNAQSGARGVPANDIRPRWVTAPLLYVFAKWMHGFIPGNHNA